MNLRVLLAGLNYAPEPTGIAPYTTRLAQHLAQIGHHVTVLTTYPHYPEWKVAEGWGGWTTRRDLEGVDVVRLRHFVPSRPSFIPRAVSEVSFGARAAAARWGRPDVVVCVSPALLSTAVVQMRAGSRTPVGVVVQDLYSAGVEETGGSRRASAALARLESRSLRSADGVAVIHERFRRRAVETLGVANERVEVIRNWTHVTRDESADRAWTRSLMGWADDELVILHTGAMGRKQGLSNVVEAARLAQDSGVRARIVLLGDGGERVALMEQARGVSTLEFAPTVPDERYMAVLQAADLLLVNERPGLHEMAVPSKLTSYFASGGAVLAATEARSTTADELEASGAGVRVDPGDPGALLRAALRLGADSERRMSLGRAGMAYCAGVLSEATALDAYAAWVERLAASRSSGESS